MMSCFRHTLISSHISPSNMKILLYFFKMSQVLSYIAKVIVARRCQMGSRPLTGAAHPAHSSDVLR